MSVIIDLTIFPMDKQGPSLSPYVARIINVIKDSGLNYQLGPMGTAIEGEWDEVMEVVDACYKKLEPDCDRIYLAMKADCRKDRTNGMSGKVESVQSKLNSI
ncbi:MTH1187 family thiamine-binding protein [Pseudodesulfovibrio sp. zrk46]|uniref:MTH1187 family thiamine-binding protein n=1 Tax=Pseudodesulfovibrio sp. zrk46 TaxID=2725288 RepID=UPI0014496BB4|nr:MTH1187 family thiamine-binding protein [Pseudodesulfovibrio sp. zrk46]QJB55187.1 MTH1187 family thiamine-binding protein [Pseudodesulfovibrio sp. zrk46]